MFPQFSQTRAVVASDRPRHASSSVAAAPHACKLVISMPPTEEENECELGGEQSHGADETTQLTSQSFFPGAFSGDGLTGDGIALAVRAHSHFGGGEFVQPEVRGDSDFDSAETLSRARISDPAFVGPKPFGFELPPHFGHHAAEGCAVHMIQAQHGGGEPKGVLGDLRDGHARGQKARVDDDVYAARLQPSFDPGHLLGGKQSGHDALLRVAGREFVPHLQRQVGSGDDFRGTKATLGVVVQHDAFDRGVERLVVFEGADAGGGRDSRVGVSLLEHGAHAGEPGVGVQTTRTAGVVGETLGHSVRRGDRLGVLHEPSKEPSLYGGAVDKDSVLLTPLQRHDGDAHVADDGRALVGARMSVVTGGHERLLGVVQPVTFHRESGLGEVSRIVSESLRRLVAVVGASDHRFPVQVGRGGCHAA